MNAAHPLLRNPRRITPPSQRIGLAKWRRLPVEGQGRPLYMHHWSDRPLTLFALAVAAYFVFRFLP